MGCSVDGGGCLVFLCVNSFCLVYVLFSFYGLEI